MATQIGKVTVENKHMEDLMAKSSNGAWLALGVAGAVAAAGVAMRGGGSRSLRAQPEESPIMNGRAMERMVDNYLACALWSSNDESTPDGGEPLDANFSVSDFTNEARARATKDCREFVKKAEKAGVEWEQDAGQVGHDFWLTRNSHGTGFWDRGLKHGKTLSKIAEAFGEQHPWTDGERVHLE
jgi:hypothetical protein